MHYTVQRYSRRSSCDPSQRRLSSSAIARELWCQREAEQTFASCDPRLEQARRCLQGQWPDDSYVRCLISAQKSTDEARREKRDLRYLAEGMALQVGTERRLLRIASRARQHEVVLEEGMHALLEAEERLSRNV